LEEPFVEIHSTVVWEIWQGADIGLSKLDCCVPSICPRIIGAILAIAILAAPALAQTYTYDAGSRLIQLPIPTHYSRLHYMQTEINSRSHWWRRLQRPGTPAITNALTVAGRRYPSTFHYGDKLTDDV